MKDASTLIAPDREVLFFIGDCSSACYAWITQTFTGPI